jgi:hypothetical protein
MLVRYYAAVLYDLDQNATRLLAVTSLHWLTTVGLHRRSSLRSATDFCRD